MKTAFKIILSLLLVLSSVLSASACGNNAIDEDVSRQTTANPLVSTAPVVTDKAPGGVNEEVFPTLEYTPVDFEIRSFFEGEERVAQTDRMGYLVYWYDQDWCGSVVNFSKRQIEGNTISVSISHTGSCWYGAQLFYNPEGTENSCVYKVAVDITASVDTEITISGKTYKLEKDKEQQIVYYRYVDMHPDDTEYQYGDSVFSLQFGTENPERDMVDGNYIITFISIDMAPYKV